MNETITKSTQTTRNATLGAKATIGLVLLAIVMALSVLLVVQNFQTITVRLFQAEIRIRLGWALLAAVVFGVGLSIVLRRLFERR